jgi:succinoglycan biosynthesis transport protein ExoP
MRNALVSHLASRRIRNTAPTGEASARTRPRKVLWFGLVLLGGAGALTWTAFQPKLYRAECILQYGHEPPASSEGQAEDALSRNERYRTQDFLLTSRSVAARVVQKLELTKDRGFFEVPRQVQFAPGEQEAIARLQQHLIVERVNGTRLVRLSALDTSPQRAARLANIVAEQYIEMAMRNHLASTQRALDWMRDQMRHADEHLMRTENEMNALLDPSASSFASQEQQEIVSNEVRQLSNSLTQLRMQRIELTARIAKLKGVMREDPFETHAVEFDNHEQVKLLQADFLATELRHRQLISTQDHMSEMTQRRLDALRAQLRSELDGIVRSVQAELTQVQTVESQLTAQLQKLRLTSLESQKHALQLRKLERQHQETEDLLKTLKERSTATGLTSAAGASYASIIEPASVPLNPSSQLWLRNGGLGAAAGALLAAILRFVAQAPE